MNDQEKRAQDRIARERKVAQQRQRVDQTRKTAKKKAAPQPEPIKTTQPAQPLPQVTKEAKQPDTES